MRQNAPRPVEIREMRASEREQVADKVRLLARDTNVDVVPQVTGEHLREFAHLVQVSVAVMDGEVVGVCLVENLFSTYRGARGLYVVDLYVDESMRGQQIGQRLLRQAVLQAGEPRVQFIKLDVDIHNHQAKWFYQRLGYEVVTEDVTMRLDAAGVEALLRDET